MIEDISFTYFIQQMSAEPALLISVVLTLGVIFVNGWTDAPNAIATCVSTRCMDVGKAIVMAAVWQLFRCPCNDTYQFKSCYDNKKHGKFRE